MSGTQNLQIGITHMSTHDLGKLRETLKNDPAFLDHPVWGVFDAILEGATQGYVGRGKPTCPPGATIGGKEMGICL